MSINNTQTRFAGSPYVNQMAPGMYAGYETGQRAKNVFEKEENFMRKVTEKVTRYAAGSKETEYAEKAFASVGSKAPEEVKRAWMDAAKETGVNGLGIGSDGMITHISQMMTQRLKRSLTGGGDTNDILGNSVSSAIRAAKEALHDLEYPRSPDHNNSIEVQRQRMKERAFYQAFLKNLGDTTQTAGKDSAGGVMKCVRAGDQEVLLCSDALMSYASPQTGESVNIYRSENYTKENPVYLLKGLDAAGNPFEMEVNAGEIDPNHCSYNELMVLNVETGHTSPSDYMHAVMARDKAGAGSYFDKMNYLAYAREIMNEKKMTGSWDSYLSCGKWIESLLKYCSRKGGAVL